MFQGDLLAFGTCDGYCGGPGSEGEICYCDDRCVRSGDCCSDYQQVCTSSLMSTPPGAVIKTGQTISYAAGDDGDFQKGVAWPNPRFTDNLDGTVTDNLTGLIWLKNASRFGNLNWYDALSECNNLADDGIELTDSSTAGDWRLPNKNELLSLVHYGTNRIALPNTAGTGQWKEGDPFTQLNRTFYWTSTTYAGHDVEAYRVSFCHGGGHRFKTSDFRITAWCVRGPNGL